MKTHGEFNPSRRHLLTGAAAIAAAGLVGSALPAAAKAPLLKTQAPAFYRFNVGGFEATVVSDGLIVGVPKTTFVGPAAANVEKMMTDLFLPPDKLVMDQNALVINNGDKVALFETGMASVKRTEDMGLLIGNLKAAGIDPKDIDYLIPSHAHIDHIGGILAADGSRNFPNAQIFIAQMDLEYWTNEGLAGTPSEGSMRAARNSTQNVNEDKPQLRACRRARNAMRFMAWSGRRAGSNDRKETEPGC